MPDDLTFTTDFPPATREQWLKLVESVLKGAPFEKRLVSKTYDGLRLEPLYGRNPSAEPIAGRAPGAAWSVVQRVEHPDPAAANAEALHELESGATGLTLVFAGAAASHGYGLASSPDVLARVLDGIYLDGMTLDLEFGWNTDSAPAHVAALVKRWRVNPTSVDLHLGFDPIGAGAVSGGSPADWPVLAPRLTEAIRALASEGFRGPFATADGRMIHAAGGSEAQELAFCLATAIAYLRAFEAGGAPLDTARRWISFKLAADADQFLTIAKFRAIRKLWARVEQACGLGPQPTFVAAETAWRMMTRRDPWVNLLRATVAVFAAGVGGANAITALPFTAALGLPDRLARRLARNTQLVLIEEASIAKVLDPAAGSGAVEDVTRQLCEAAWSLFQEIEKAGGAWQALVDGLIQRKITKVRAEREHAIATGRDALTGTSAFPDIHELPVAVLAVPRVQAALPGSDRVKIEPLPQLRLAEPFEALRDVSDRAVTMTGMRPRIFLANLGTTSDFGARAMFAKNFFEAGGIEATANDGFTDVAELAVAFQASGARLVCLCSSDAVYARQAAPAAAALSKAGAMLIYLAGRPGEHEAALKAAGVQSFVYDGCDMLATLQSAHGILGL